MPRPPSGAVAYASFDHRSRKAGVRPVRYFASDPCTGSGVRLPRVRTLLIGPWKVSITRRRGA